MATKSYSKHKEFKEFSTKSTVPYNSDEQFDMIKSELLPKGSKLGALAGGGGGGESEYHYEYHEDRHPSGKYERKDLRTVEQYTVPANSTAEHSSYFYSRDENLPAVTTSHYENTTSSPGYSHIKTKAAKDLSHNVDELDSLLDDLQRDQERQLYKGGYTSDTAESSSFDYRKTSTPVKSTTPAPSSGYSTLRTERVDSGWRTSPLPAPAPSTIQRESEMTRELYREEKTESRVVPSQVSPALPQPVPAILCHQCHQPGSTLTRPGAMNKVTTTVKTYTYEVPADQQPSELRWDTTERHHKYAVTDTAASAVPPSPSLGCQYCSQCNSRVTQREYSTSTLAASPPPQPQPLTTRLTERRYDAAVENTSTVYPRNERVLYPAPANDVRTPANLTDHPPANGHGPNGPSTYKWSETKYSAYNTTERHPVGGAGAPPSPAPFPRPHTPSASAEPPKRLDDLLAEFPEARFPTSQPDGVVRRQVEVRHESSNAKKNEVETVPAKSNSKNVAGPAVYYPPGHVPFQKKEAAYEASAASAGGGAYAAGRGMYEYESGSKSKEKKKEGKAIVPVCLPLCCAMPCTIM